MGKTSIIVPARNEPYLAKTIDELFSNATGEIEIILMLDNYWPVPPIKSYDNLTMVHAGEIQGMRNNINSAVRIATGEYLMKIDAHCKIGKGFDEILQADCEENWLAIPSRYSLDHEKWERTRGPINYLTLTYPYVKDAVYGSGLHGKKWRGEFGLEGDFWYKEKERKEITIDDILIFQGSCWFMHKKHFIAIDGFNPEHGHNVFQEAQELCFKTWLSGGRVIRNKNTWYAHMHKTRETSGNYGLSKKEKHRAEDQSVEYWLNDRWEKQTKSFKWLIHKFWPLAGWPEDWGVYNADI